eukprot:TRINITY_DN1444_c0_g1_i1.p1 TRINITY_DN1444_c0_g1~~TRINITY_DN1444_c0_g1_i1.p1  ORF type:complete len:210 (+),score=16.98 TRINITY_DN1444_c0_g1_i1:244-873(+)
MDESCSSNGECKKSLARCNCSEAYTSDDCSAHGVFRLRQGGTSKTRETANSGNFPPIDIDNWGYWSLPVGCYGVSLNVEMTVDVASPGARPLLVIRRGTLPLQLESSLDYYDFYFGKQSYSLSQRIEITDCNGQCEIRPGDIFGTTYATDSLEPGIYFVGIYNDHNARGPLQNYTVRYWLEGSCTSGCSKGFLESMNEKEKVPTAWPLV